MPLPARLPRRAARAGAGATRRQAIDFCERAIDSARAFLRAFPLAPTARRELALALACRSALRTAAGDHQGAQQDADELQELLAMR